MNKYWKIKTRSSFLSAQKYVFPSSQSILRQVNKFVTIYQIHTTKYYIKSQTKAVLIVQMKVKFALVMIK
jgi:hypothetical protein